MLLPFTDKLIVTWRCDPECAQLATRARPPPQSLFLERSGGKLPPCEGIGSKTQTRKETR